LEAGVRLTEPRPAHIPHRDQRPRRLPEVGVGLAADVLVSEVCGVLCAIGDPHA